ncbi:pentatricopeptide repeat-containing protein, mitochondrial-like [Iris pallida]|uniref:Pentatricopeptide repeat-containing protein, mitochondrial-like n=1 Tax=Iris pallida TaxID=29817 RepID=A0AAX6DGC5_IRIPA|nr:pentatricopeptide repeat-containing protein, mitochondrial-like [Iris pallida]
MSWFHKPPFPNYNHLLHQHQHKRSPTLQIHSQLISTSRIANACVALWNALIKHYSNGPFPQEAVHCYKQMPPRAGTDTFTLSYLLKACANLSSPRTGAQFHSLAVKQGFALGVYVHTALVNMYSSCRCLAECQRAFEEMPERNTVTWNALITGFVKWGETERATSLFKRMPCPDVVSWTGIIDGYARARRPKEALLTFREMAARGVRPTEITVLAVVPSVSNLGSLEAGEALHAHCLKGGLDRVDVRVENSLIDMYAKCGSIEKAVTLFSVMGERKNLVSWTSILSGFAMHGMAKEAVEWFRDMRQAGVRPNRVTFLSVLSACGHAGLVEEGLAFFSNMVYEYGMEPDIRHYGCVIDMLGRAGRLGEAEGMIKRVPVEVNAVVWRTLLGCCCKHGEVEMGKRFTRKIMELEEEYGGDYVMLSNMLTGVGRFGDAERVRRVIDERNLVKVPGLSLMGG